jgi:mRNA interferase HigB
MRIIALKRLKDHWALPNRRDSEQPLKAWYAVAKEADWAHFADVKEQFRSASSVGERVVFNIAGNKYRLVAYINYEFRIAYVRFVGTHREYDELDVKNV